MTNNIQVRDANGALLTMSTIEIADIHTTVTVPFGNTFFEETSIALGANSTFTGPARDIGVSVAARHSFSFFRAICFSDQQGTFRIDASNDGITWFWATPVTAYTANVPLAIETPVMARYHRVVVACGANGQTRLHVNSAYTAA